MDSLQRLGISASLLVGSAVASILYIVGAGLNMSAPVKWVLYFPFYGVLYFFSLVWELTGFRALNQILFLVGVVLTAVYLAILLEKIPRNVVYCGLGVIFFVFLLILGRGVFVRLISVSQSTLGTAVYSVKVFLEFLICLVILYVVLGEGSVWDKNKG